MRINGTGSTNASSKSKKTKSSQQSGGNFGALLAGSSAGEKQGAASVGGASGIEGIDALLALQEISDEGGGNKQAYERSEAILDQLDAIRDGLLNGHFSKDTLNRLTALVSEKKDGFIDPALEDILDDIALRASIELAKYERAL